MHGLVSRAMAAGTTGTIAAADATNAAVSAVPKVCPAALNFAKDQKKVRKTHISFLVLNCVEHIFIILQTFEADPKLIKTLSDKLGPQITSKVIISESLHQQRFFSKISHIS